VSGNCCQYLFVTGSDSTVVLHHAGDL